MPVPILLTLSTALVLSGRAQTPAPAPPAQKPEVPVVPAPKPVPPSLADDRPLVGSDGQPLVPGRLPENTDAAARAAWEKTLAATVGPAGERKPVTAFSLGIDAIYKARVEQNNQVKGRYEYLAPGFVRITLEETRRELLRGPDGDWLVDPAREGATKLERVRDNEQDLKQLDDLVAIARNFLALTDPKSLRIARLARLPAPPAGLAEPFAKQAATLVWLDVVSPDFRLARATAPGQAPRLYRVQLGLDAKTSLPALALLHDGSSEAPIAPTTLFLALGEWFDANGYQVPKLIQTYEIDEGSLAAGAADPLRLRFRRDATSDVVLTSARINPDVTADAFRPRKKG